MTAVPEHNNSPMIKTTESKQGLAYWRGRTDLPAELQDTIAKANLLIVPWESFRSLKYPVFPTETEELFDFLRVHSTPTITPEIYTTESEYKELALHSDTIHLATMVFDVAIWPVLSGILANYIFSKLGRNRETGSVRFKAHITDRQRTIELEYDGPATAFQQTVTEALSKNQLSTNESPPSHPDQKKA